MINEKIIMNNVWSKIIDFYNIETNLKPRLIKKDRSAFGSGDKSKCSKDIILVYSPKKLIEELSIVKYNKEDYEKFLVFAFAESLSMGVQKLLVSRNCKKDCNLCRCYNNSLDFKLLNYVITYYVADYIVYILFREKMFGLKRILHYLDNPSAKAIMSALNIVYSKNNSKNFIIRISRNGNDTFYQIFPELTKLK